MDEEAKPPIGALKWLLGPFAVFAAMSVIADWIWPSLVTDHPLTLLILSVKNRYLLLTAPQLGMTTFFVVGFLRLIASDPLTFLLGRYYGEGAIEWIEDKTSTKPKGQSLIRKAERLFDRAAPVVIFVAPSALWCVLAGAARMKVWVFVVCNLAGTFFRLVLFWYAADVFRDELDTVLEFIDGVQIPLLVVTITLGVIHAARNRRRVPAGEAITDLEGAAGIELIEEYEER